MLNQITLPSIPQVRSSAIDHYTVCDMSGFVQVANGIRDSLRRKDRGSWIGGKSFAESLDCVRSGDLAAVPESEKYLHDMESHTFLSKAYRIRDDVCGGAVNIPAFVSGVPVHMRRRERVTSAVAPLSIFVDLTSSASIQATDLFKRGAAILALVRLLSNMRPVELSTVVAVSPFNLKTCHIITVKLDTAPLDLARAAHMLTHASVPRALCYGIAEEQLNHASEGSLCWPYGHDPNLFRNNAESIMRRVVTPGSDVLFIPSIHTKDKAIQNPVTWIKTMLHTFGGNVVQENGN